MLPSIFKITVTQMNSEVKAEGVLKPPKSLPDKFGDKGRGILTCPLIISIEISSIQYPVRTSIGYVPSR